MEKVGDHELTKNMSQVPGQMETQNRYRFEENERKLNFLSICVYGLFVAATCSNYEQGLLETSERYSTWMLRTTGVCNACYSSA